MIQTASKKTETASNQSMYIKDAEAFSKRTYSSKIIRTNYRTLIFGLWMWIKILNISAHIPLVHPRKKESCYVKEKVVSLPKLRDFAA